MHDDSGAAARVPRAGAGTAAETGAETRTVRRLVVAGAVSVAAAVAMLLVGPMGAARGPWLAVLLASWAAFGLSAWWALRAPAPAAARTRRRALGLVVLLAALCQLPALTSIPLSSTDAYRYVWDGRVQLAGVSPYRYARATTRWPGCATRSCSPASARGRRAACPRCATCPRTARPSTPSSTTTPACGSTARAP
ncbi:hypothetical protein FHR75_002690 [Kineococcus radiotolerans]|uniref:Uncharacterized protein n=1 Tax=Kineococcus radiotolerans TaxID=131568 RepID=A0A7W4XY45_KINRA|nr:hypothetical protein [Kineococcus radiotolerans]MBB2901875.1 hypothetical protein [Kineococcus radiotolerans]